MKQDHIPTRIVVEITKHLTSLAKKASKFREQIKSTVEVERKSKILTKRKNREHSLNPSRVGRIKWEEIKDRELRKLAKDVSAKLNTAFENVTLHSRTIFSGIFRVEKLTDTILKALLEVEQASDNLPKYIEQLENATRSLRRERRGEL